MEEQGGSQTSREGGGWRGRGGGGTHGGHTRCSLGPATDKDERKTNRPPPPLLLLLPPLLLPPPPPLEACPLKIDKVDFGVALPA